MGSNQNVIILSMFTVLAASEFETQKITCLLLGIWRFENDYIGTKSTQGEYYQNHYQSKYNNWDKTSVGWKLLPFSSSFFWFTLSNRNTYPNAHLLFWCFQAVQNLSWNLGLLWDQPVSGNPIPGKLSSSSEHGGGPVTMQASGFPRSKRGQMWSAEGNLGQWQTGTGPTWAGGDALLSPSWRLDGIWIWGWLEIAVFFQRWPCPNP